jgi:peptidoglycan/LPS O-acetylase OafA/YrhL
LRRFLRLSPLYLIVLAFLYVTGSLTLSDFALRIIFLDAFIPAVFARDPIGVLWTLSVEFWCSLMVPMFVITLRSKFKFFWLAFYFFISISSPKLLIWLGVTDLMAYKSIPSAFFCFAIGVYLTGFNSSAGEVEGFKILVVFSLGFLLMYLQGGYMGAWWISILLTVSFLGYRRTKLNQPESNPFMLFLGTICYGIYLLHMPMLIEVSEFSQIFAFYLTFPITLVLAALSWKFIERPMSLKLRKGKE